jgi:hypothetical protein
MSIFHLLDRIEWGEKREKRGPRQLINFDKNNKVKVASALGY